MQIHGHGVRACFDALGDADGEVLLVETRLRGCVLKDTLIPVGACTDITCRALPNLLESMRSSAWFETRIWAVALCRPVYYCVALWGSTLP